MKLSRHLSARDPHEPHRVATPLELFYDLVSVIAIASVTAGLHHAISEGHGVEALPKFIFLFLAIWWAWMNFTWFASAFDNDGPLYRVLVMVVMSGALIFAGGADYIFKTMDFSWGLLGWIVMRMGMAALWLLAAVEHRFRKTALRYFVGILIAQLAWTVLYFGTVPGSTLFYLGGGVCFLIEWLVPMFAERAGQTPWHRHHIMERYGLLTIIVLGEILLSVSMGFGLLFGGEPAWEPVLSSVSAIVIVFSLWWLYFDREEHLTATHYARAFTWGYGHVFFFAAAAALGAGIAAELDLAANHSKVGHAVTAWYIGLPMGVALMTLWAIRDRFHPLGYRSYSLPVMSVVFILGSVFGLPSGGFAAICLVTLGWRTVLSRQEEIS